MYKNCFLWISFTILFIAGCGGNDGRGDQSDSFVNTCNGMEGAVFVDGVCSPWQDISAFEQSNSDFVINEDFTDGESGHVVSFSTLHSPDADHNRVIDIVYADDVDYSGAVRIRAPDNGGTNRIDMRQYAGGKIRFDIKLINAGVESPDLEFVIECASPCGSTPEIIKPDELNKWQTFELSVAELIDKGLNINQVSLGFMLSPTWKKQSGVHFQIDNIRWIKGLLPETDEKVCFANHIDPPDGKAVTLLNLWGETFEIDMDQSFSMLNFNYFYLKIVPDWSETKGLWVYGLSEPYIFEDGEFLNESNLYECSSEGVLSMDVYVDRGLVNDGNIKFRIVFIDAFKRAYELSGEDILVSSMKPNDWNRISVDLSPDTRMSNVWYIGLKIDSSDVGDNTQGGIAIDNIVIKHTIGN